MRAAAESDPDAAGFLRHNDQLRSDGYRAAIDLLCDKAALRPERTPERATDMMLLFVGPAAYRALVGDGAWSHAEWIDWTTATFLEVVFGVRTSE